MATQSRERQIIVDEIPLNPLSQYELSQIKHFAKANFLMAVLRKYC